MSNKEVTPAQEQNASFGVPAEVEANIRAKAAEDAGTQAGDLYQKILAEEQAKLEAGVRARVAKDLSIAEEGAGTAESHGFPDRYVRLVVSRGSQKHDQSYVPVSVNGYVWQIERGVEVVVPDVVVNGLNDAVTEVAIQTEGGLITRPSHRFPFQVLGPATKEQYQAQRAAGKRAA